MALRTPPRSGPSFKSPVFHMGLDSQLVVKEDKGRGELGKQNPVFLSFLCVFFPSYLFMRQVFQSLGEGVEKTNMRPTHTSYSGQLRACQYSVLTF